MEDEDLLRYSRQIMLPQIDVSGQEKLTAARVLVFGVGGLGSPVAMYLAASGVGELVLCDPDIVDLSNLQRQIVHDTGQLEVAKVQSAAQRIQQLNPQVKLTLIEEKLIGDVLQHQVGLADVVVDCTDNLQARFAINAACVQAKTPLVSGAAIRWEGQVAVFDKRMAQNPCYHCFYGGVGSIDETCHANGVVGPLLGIIGSMQALEVVKLICEVGESLAGRVLLFDALYMEWNTINLPRNPSCEVCGDQ